MLSHPAAALLYISPKTIQPCGNTDKPEIRRETGKPLKGPEVCLLRMMQSTDEQHEQHEQPTTISSLGQEDQTCRGCPAQRQAAAVP